MAEKQLRNSNFELLRILSMTAIIGYHFYLQTAAYGTSCPLSGTFAMFFGSFGRSAVNVFVMIGAWFLIDMRFSVMRMIRLYLACLLYAVFFTLLVVVLKLPPAPPSGEAAFKALLRALTPFSSSPLWFVTDYLLLLFLSPFLNRFLHGLSAKAFRILFFALLVIFVLIPTVESAIPGFAVYRNYVVKSDMAWMIALYCLTGYWKRSGEPRFLRGRSSWLCLFGLMGCSALLCILCHFPPAGKLPAFAVRKFHAFCEFLFMDLSSVFCFLLAASAFFSFRQLAFTSGTVNRIARHTLGIYIIHQIPVFIPVMWGVFRVDAWISSPFFPLLEAGVILAVFWGCFSIDCAGSALLSLLLRTSWFERLSRKIDPPMNDEVP